MLLEFLGGVKVISGSHKITPKPPMGNYILYISKQHCIIWIEIEYMCMKNNTTIQLQWLAAATELFQ